MQSCKISNGAYVMCKLDKGGMIIDQKYKGPSMIGESNMVPI